MTEKQKARYHVEIVPPYDARVGKYIDSVSISFPVSHRAIFTPSRRARCGRIALLIRNHRSVTVGIAALELPQEDNGNRPALLFTWANNAVYKDSLDRELLIALSLYSLQQYNVLPDITEILKIDEQVGELRSSLLMAKETMAVGITSAAAERLTSTRQGFSIFAISEARFAEAQAQKLKQEMQEAS